jgi:PHP family Zn ribbon phosphoesterase
LSSDPAMNWRVSFLDRYRPTSNSDAHSPGKLGREATRFSCEPDFFAMRRVELEEWMARRMRVTVGAGLDVA